MDETKEEINITDKIEKRGRKRINREENYVNERNMICKKILEILNITLDKNYFITDYITENEIKEVCNLMPDIRKYYLTSNWRMNRFTEERSYTVSIIRHILKENNIEYLPKYMTIMTEGKQTSIHKYIILNIHKLFI